jgi:SPP1 gp7 family putative phage head morphogenesis protein
VEVNVVLPSAIQLWAAAVSQPFDGAVLAAHAQEFTAAIRARLDSAISTGFAEGKSIPDIVRMIRGTRAGGYTDGIIATIGAPQAKALARTAVQHVAAVAREETFRQNGDLLSGERFTATLDDRTTVLCASLDGKVYPIGEGPQIPLHWNCRSCYTPVVKSWEELGLPAQDIKPGTRSSMNGYVPDKLTYEEWLREQPAEMQRDVLGATRYDLWKDGTPLSGFVADGMRELSVAELLAR